jgi:hypothetical protein
MWRDTTVAGYLASSLPKADKNAGEENFGW